jgi:hypothetical protein
METFENELEELEGVEMHAEKSKSFEPAPAGPHVARCYSYIQLGTQKTEYNGIPGKDRMKIVLGFELPEELNVFDPAKGAQPYTITQTLSLVLGSKSTFQKVMESWTQGKINDDFNPIVMLGKACQINVKHEQSTKDPDRVYAKIDSIIPLLKNQVCPPQINPYKYLLFQRWNQDTFNSLPEWQRKAIELSPEYKQLGKPLAAGNKEGQYNEKKNPVDPYKKPPTVAEEALSADGLPF